MAQARQTSVAVTSSPRMWLWDAGLAILTLIVFAPVLFADFINLDDPLYVLNNRHVRTGLTLDNVVWAVTTLHNGFWHPLTWLSLQADASLFGIDRPWGFHLVNLLWHLATVLTLFHALAGMTGAVARSGVTALLFAVHPLRVESVAWITERKDVLAAFFWVLALWAYGRFARSRCMGMYVTVLVAMALSLMSKPMAVTLPFALLLVDFWPLGRRDWRRAVLEKVPLLILTLVFSVLTWQAHREHLGNILETAPLSQRVGYALTNYGWYLEKTFWPSGLTMYYPYVDVDRLPLRAALCLVVLAALTLSAWALRRREPAVLSGWLWFLGTLVPVIGLVTSGESVTDRFTYIPHIGLAWAIVWLIADATAWFARLQVTLVVVAAALLGLRTFEQSFVWQDSFAVWTHALEITGPKNAMAHKNLGGAYFSLGGYRPAEEHFRIALALDPNDANIAFYLGSTLALTDRNEEAAKWLGRALALRGDHIDSHLYQGIVLTRLGRGEEAERHFRRALELAADDPEQHDRVRRSIREFAPGVSP